MTVIVDYGRGNLFSLGQALRHLGVAYTVSSDPVVVGDAGRLVVPGVGAFGDAIAVLRERGLVEPLKAAAARGIPILGICVGCQLLLSRGEEFGDHEGLGLIPGVVSRLPGPAADNPAAIRIPNVGWRRVQPSQQPSPLQSVSAEDMMYFVHSYAPRPTDAGHVLATIRINGEDVPAAVGGGSVIGVQFHPEKSGPAGLRLLGQMLEHAPGPLESVS